MPKSLLRRWLVALGLALWTAGAARGQTAPAAPAAAPAPMDVAAAFPRGIWSVLYENDTYFGTDRDFTSAGRIAYATPNYDDWAKVPVIPNVFGEGLDEVSFLNDPFAVMSAAFYAQYDMFTPSNLNLSNPPPTDRPYAGWLGFGADWMRQTAERRALLELNLGLVGPYSGAESAQKIVHNLIGANQPEGWPYQIKTEPVLQLTYRQDWRAPGLSQLDGSKTLLAHDVLLHGTVTAGNGWDYAAAGFLVRAGYHLPLDYGPARIVFGEVDALPYQIGGTPANASSARDLSAYFCLGGEDRAIARDITLDGNTFAKSRSVSKEPFVAQVFGGPVLEYHGARLSFIITYETKTYYAQVDNGQWRGLFNVGYGF